MKRYLLSIFISFLVSIGTFAQSSLIDWQTNLGGDTYDGAIVARELSTGELLTAGYAYSSDGDVHDHNGSMWNSDAWVVKMTASGDTIWTRSYGGYDADYGRDIIETSDGNYLLAVNSYSDDLDVSANYGSADFWILKLDTAGNILWEQNYGGSKPDKPQHIYETPGGNFIIGGTSESEDSIISTNFGVTDFWVMSIDTDGNLLWEQNYGGSSSDDMKSLRPALDGDLILTGYTWSDDSMLTSNNGLIDYLIIKIDTLGNTKWVKNYGGSLWDYGYDTYALKDGGYIVSGLARSNDIDVSNNYGDYDAWILKLDNNGDLLWEKNYGGSSYDAAYSIIENSTNGYVFTGITASSDDDITNSYDNDDIWVANIDSLGDIIWSEVIGGDSTDQGFSIMQAQDNSYILTGLTQSNEIDVTNGIHGNWGYEDYWVMKLKCRPSLTPDICMVTVDSTSSKNLIIWERPSALGIDSFKVYRDIVGTYTHIGSVDYSATMQFVDTTNGIDPATTSYRYKISSVDTCGFESPLSNHHETIHLTTSLGTGGDINLVWDDYEGFSFTKYYILRDSTGTGIYEVLDSVTSNNFTYTDQNPPTTTSVTYVIEVVSPNNCDPTKAANFNSSRSNRPPPIMSGVSPTTGFVANTTTVVEGSIVNYTDISSNNPTSWQWSFTGGTPSTSTAQNPQVTYNTNGVYDASLIATNSFGSDTLTITSYITVTPAGVAPVADLTATAQIIEQGQTIDFIDFSSNSPTQWFWIFSNGTPATSTAQNPNMVQYNTVGSFDVTLIVSNNFGSDTIVKPSFITVTTPGAGSAPVSNFTASATSIAEGETVDFFDISTNNPTSWQWIFSNGTPATSTAQNPNSIQYNIVGTHEVTLIATNNSGSHTETKTDYITVNPTSTGLTSKTKNETIVFPNPNNGTFVINTNWNSPFVVSIFNSVGKLVFEKIITNNSAIIDLDVANGSYIIHLISADEEHHIYQKVNVLHN